uniref:Uncharacterized protein n=1 Tax=Romanomermis culicivorax TaxID=13658 RepID=A0A915KK45_ROMCU
MLVTDKNLLTASNDIGIPDQLSQSVTSIWDALGISSCGNETSVSDASSYRNLREPIHVIDCHNKFPNPTTTSNYKNNMNSHLPIAIQKKNHISKVSREPENQMFVVLGGQHNVAICKKVVCLAKQLRMFPGASSNDCWNKLCINYLRKDEKRDGILCRLCLVSQPSFLVTVRGSEFVILSPSCVFVGYADAADAGKRATVSKHFLREATGVLDQRQQGKLLRLGYGNWQRKEDGRRICKSIESAVDAGITKKKV